MLCVCRYCRASIRLSELAKMLSVSRSGLLIARDRCEKQLINDKKIKEDLERIEEMLKYMS